MVYKCTIAGSVPLAAAESNFRPLKRKAGTESLVPARVMATGRLQTRPLAAFAALTARSYNVPSRRTHVSARYWTLHWLRVLLWPLPVLSLMRAGRAAATAVRRR
jgi:hypothetical protein